MNGNQVLYVDIYINIYIHIYGKNHNLHESLYFKVM